MLSQKVSASGASGMIAATPTMATGATSASVMASSLAGSGGGLRAEGTGDGVHVGDQAGLRCTHELERDPCGEIVGDAGLGSSAHPAQALLRHVERGVAGGDAADRGEHGGV